MLDISHALARNQRVWRFVRALPQEGLVMDRHRTALGLFAVALAIAILVASVTTLERVNTRQAANDAPPGTTGLARPHPAA
jgi:hypothetical protein